jgi:hypothetical protein
MIENLKPEIPKTLYMFPKQRRLFNNLTVWADEEHTTKADISGIDMIIAVKNDYSDSDANAVFIQTISSATYSDPTHGQTGVIELTVTNADKLIASQKAGGVFYYSIYLPLLTDRPILRGQIEILYSAYLGV